MTRRLTSTSHGKKLLFNRILSNELDVCKYKIKAFYEWKNRTQMFSLKFIDYEHVELGINLNFKEEDLFFGSANAMGLSICYRVYFITNYLRSLESAEEIVPKTLFQGLVVLEAIKNIHAGDVVALYSPLPATATSKVKPINIHCAIRSLSRLLIEHKNYFPVDVQARCESNLNWMITYTRLPEVEYNKPKKPEYAVLRDVLDVKKLTDETPTILKRYSIFSQCGISSFNSQTINELLMNESFSEFWTEAFLRVLVFSENMNLAIDVTDLPQMHKAIIEFKEESVAYYQESNSSENVILTDNLLAVKKIAMKIDQVFFSEGPVESRALHFIQ